VEIPSSKGTQLGMVEESLLYSNLSFIGNTTFYGNLALRYGGGVYGEENSAIKTSGSMTFVSNSANDGGGIYTWLGDVNISGNATFSDNSLLIEVEELVHTVRTLFSALVSMGISPLAVM